MQLALDNSGGELMPGGYASVRLPLLRDAVPLHIPASALIFNQNGLRVATVGPDDKVLFKTVTIARDLGKEIETRLRRSRPTTASSSRRPTASPMAIRSALSAPAPRQAGDRIREAGREGVGRSCSFVMRAGSTRASHRHALW